MATGKLKWFDDNKGYGLISLDDSGVEVIVMDSAVSSETRAILDAHVRLEFDVVQGITGLEADNLHALGPLEGPGTGGGGTRPAPQAGF
ncbi:cold-shock protein [Pengzhenrongella sicca]|uniref:Cold-shock protein n=1 Tax=Pengzhenrongella sicca TaxID=2819238 RepID=A0A8A4Z9U8_9MICO|nr:cold shock domain-containing protein [Pengzhenrongella sicca]QTE28245.1 cold-shock protein [Pengzhenrongella sicca]